jgi:hypothetical protein
MNRSDLENDLQDLIEGRLPADRADAVRAALESDASLVRLVRGLMADRSGLIGLGRATEQAARADRAAGEEMVREAVARAEREALVGGSTRGGRRRWRPIAAAAAVVVGVGLLAGGLTYLTLAREHRLLQSEIKRQERASGGRFEVVEPEPRKPGEGTVLAADPAEPPPTEEVKVASLPSWINLDSDPLAEEAVRVWTREAWRTFARDAPKVDHDAVALAALERIRAGGSRRLTLEEAAALARTRSLRLVVPKGGVDWLRRRSEAYAAAPPPPPGAEVATSADGPAASDEVRVTVRSTLDPDLAGLRDGLADLRQRLGGGDDGWFEIEEGDVASAGALPSSALGDILWWSNEPSAWTPGTSVVVRVTFSDGAK